MRGIFDLNQNLIFDRFDVMMNEKHVFKPEDFTVQAEIDRGNYSRVEIAVTKDQKQVVLKRLYYWNSPKRIKNEIQMLQKIKYRHIIDFYGAFRDKDEYILVFPYIPHVPFRVLIPMKYKTIAQYLHGLLSALVHLHSENIIHRDIKPSNYLFDQSTGKGYLIDFGFCEEYHPAQTEIKLERPKFKECLTANHTGTPGFRAPEVLLASNNQTTAIDIWAVGIIFLSCLTLRYPFFLGKNDFSALIEYMEIFGSDSIDEVAQECHRVIIFSVRFPKRDLHDMIYALNPYINELEIPSSAFDLLSHLLEPVPSKRITASQARMHPFFIDSGIFH